MHHSFLPIVPAYNAEKYVEQTLRSLVTQTYPNLEIVVVDDGSTDGTLHRVESMAREHPQIRVIRQPNLGVAGARNRAIEESRGDFIAPVNADDIWFPNAVTKLVNCFLRSDSRTGVAYGWSVVIDETGLLDGRFRCSAIEGDVLGTLICHNFLGNASSTMIRRGCFEKVGGYDGDFRAESAQGCEDWDLNLRIAQYYRFKVVPEFLFGYRKLRSSMSSNPNSMAKSHCYFRKSEATSSACSKSVLPAVDEQLLSVHGLRMPLPQSAEREPPLVGQGAYDRSDFYARPVWILPAGGQEPCRDARRID